MRCPRVLRPFFPNRALRDYELINHAECELRAAGLFDKEGGALGNAVFQMVQQFASQGHSGYSADLAISLFVKLTRYEPITPLTGTDGEWIDHGEGHFQNRRCQHVFKENGVAFDSTMRGRIPVTFPYLPRPQVPPSGQA